MSAVPSDKIDEVVGRFAPAPASVAAMWPTDARDALLTRIAGSPDAPAEGLAVVHELLVEPARARHARHRALLPLAASIAILAAVAGTLVAVLPGGQDGSGPAGGAPLPAPVPYDPPAGLSAAALPNGSWSYSVRTQQNVDARGRVIAHGPIALTIRSWVDARGDVYEIRSGQKAGCSYRPNHYPAGLDAPTVAFYRSLPTDPLALRAYLRRQVNGGSSSRDNAVFVAVGDTLRGSNGLASPKLRGAFVAALSRTAGVLLHSDVRDQLGRPALRLDFVDQQIRPGEVDSLFFSPTDFRLLEERSGSNGSPDRYAGPSPAYTHSASTGRDPHALTGSAYVEIHTAASVVRHLPTALRHCPTSSAVGG